MTIHVTIYYFPKKDMDGYVNTIKFEYENK